MNSSNFRVMLMIGEGILVEKLDIINSVLILFAIPWSKSIKKVELRKSDWIKLWLLA